MNIEELKQAYMQAHSTAVIKRQNVVEAEQHLNESEREAHQSQIAAEKALLVYAHAVGIPPSRISLFACAPSDIEGIIAGK